MSRCRAGLITSPDIRRYFYAITGEGEAFSVLNPTPTDGPDQVSEGSSMSCVARIFSKSRRRFRCGCRPAWLIGASGVAVVVAGCASYPVTRTAQLAPYAVPPSASAALTANAVKSTLCKVRLAALSDLGKAVLAADHTMLDMGAPTDAEWSRVVADLDEVLLGLACAAGQSEMSIALPAPGVEAHPSTPVTDHAYELFTWPVEAVGAAPPIILRLTLWTEWPDVPVADQRWVLTAHDDTARLRGPIRDRLSMTAAKRYAGTTRAAGQRQGRFDVCG